MLLKNLKKNLDSFLEIRREDFHEGSSQDIYDFTYNYLAEHAHQLEAEEIKTCYGWGKHCAAIMIEEEDEEGKHILIVEAEDYKYTEFMMPHD